jgi:hypothetical protein
MEDFFRIMFKIFTGVFFFGLAIGFVCILTNWTITDEALQDPSYWVNDSSLEPVIRFFKAIDRLDFWVTLSSLIGSLISFVGKEFRNLRQHFHI